MYSAKIILDSLNPCGDRLTTFEVTYPRFVHSEFMTHRLFSRNSASSRAIPNEKLRKRIEEDPVMPVFWGKNQSGMQAEQEISEHEQFCARDEWLAARDLMLEFSKALSALGVHKQICNRLLEPWMYISTIVTSTEYTNFFYLRCDSNAQPEIQKIAYMMRDLYQTNSPQKLTLQEWHTPYIQSEEQNLEVEKKLKLSVARCARVSYLTHDGKRDLEADFKLYDRLLASKHFSPFEHIARALGTSKRVGNFFGWLQYRKTLAGEHYGRELERLQEYR